MFKIELSGFRTKEIAEAFLTWYIDQGEQDSSYFFEARQAEGKIDVGDVPIVHDEKDGWWVEDGNTLKAKVKT